MSGGGVHLQPGVMVNTIQFPEDAAKLMERVREFAEKKHPGEDGSYYVNKSEILKATGLDEEGYKDFIYSCRVYGYLETTGKWFRITGNVIGTVGSGGFSVPSVMANGLGSMSLNTASAPLRSLFNMPTADVDPAWPCEGEMYFNTKTKELRIYDGSQWLAIGTAPAIPCP